MWGQLRPVQAASAPSDSAAGAGINNSSAQQQQNQTTATKTAASPPAAPVAAVPLTSAKYEASADTDTSAVPAEASSSADLIANATARSIVGAGNSVSGHVSSSSKSKSESKSDPPNDATCSADNDNDNGQAEGRADIGEAEEWGFDDDPFFNDDRDQGDDVNTTDAVDSNKKPDEKDEKEEVGPAKSLGDVKTRSQTADVTKKAANKYGEEEVDDLIPPSSTMLIKTNRRLGPSTGTRSAITANKKHKSSMQPEVNPNSNSKSNDAATLELAQRKFAAAVRKIEADDDNWDFDDDDAAAGGDGEADDAAAETTAEGSSSMLHEKLVQYISSLSSTETPLVRSLNSLLEAELNTTDNCLELIHYYTTRPQLVEYTIDTELRRMDYLVITDHDQHIDKDEIQLYVETTSDQRDAAEDLLWRASNQSLLADLIAALTGDDRLIRQSMMITAIADSCKFELNLAAGGGSNRGVAVMSDLILSIPFSQGEDPHNSRLELGKVKARVLFVPEMQQLEYSIVHATSLISAEDERLRKAAASLERDLAELGIIGDSVPHVDQLSRIAHDDLRDQFLATVSTGASGLSSAFRELDTVTNLSGKLGWLKNAMPSLPTAEAIAQSEAEASMDPGLTHQQGSFPRPAAENISRGRPQRAQPRPGTRAMGFLDRLVNDIEAPEPQEQSQFPRPPSSPAANEFVDNERQSQPPTTTHAEHYQPQPSPPAPSKGAPLIGGFLVRGLANAAKGLAEAAVAADAVAEEQYARPNQERDEEVKFYRSPDNTSPPKAFTHENIPADTSTQNASATIDQLITGAMTAAGAEAEESEGWSDDEGIEIDEDDATGVSSPANVTAAAPPVEAEKEPLPKAKPEPSFISFAERLSEAADSSMASAPTVAKADPAPETELFPRPVQIMPPITAAPPSAGEKSVSTCDGSYQFVSMKGLEQELPTAKDWLAVEAVDAVDEDGVIPTRSRWRPRRMRT